MIFSFPLFLEKIEIHSFFYSLSRRRVYNVTRRPDGIIVTVCLFTGVAQRQARGAHNSEVTRSKRVAGKTFFTSQRCIKALEHSLLRCGAVEARGAMALSR